MRFYTGQHRYYCGIDLHARTMYLCMLDHETGKILLHRNLRCEPDRFLRAGAFPTAYVYPRGMRATRDLLRRRLFFVRRRSELFTHIRITFHQLNLPAPAGKFHHPRNRVGVAELIPDPVVRASVEVDLVLAARLGRASYSMLRHSTAFDMDRFMN